MNFLDRIRFVYGQWKSTGQVSKAEKAIDNLYRGYPHINSIHTCWDGSGLTVTILHEKVDDIVLLTEAVLEESNKIDDAFPDLCINWHVYEDELESMRKSLKHKEVINNEP